MSTISANMFLVSCLISVVLLLTPYHHNTGVLAAPGLGTHQPLIQQLFRLAAEQQAKADQSYVPLKQWFIQKGVYKSSIKLNFHGSPDLAQGRRLMDVYDNNMFATAWVTSSLVEAFRFDHLSRPSDEQLSNALDVIIAHRNMNTDYKTSTFAFWQQRFNATDNFWASAPTNLLSCFDLLNDLPLHVIEDILKDIGLEVDAKILEQIKNSENLYIEAFHIPPDFDDTFVNLELGALLYEMKDEFGAAWTKWSEHNTNITSVFDALKKYAYRPFSKDPNVNEIDPRTYFYLREFLDNANQTGQDVALVTTWIQNIEELRTQFFKGVVMPFSVNNVDLTVAANTVFGMTSSVLAGVVSPDIFDDKDIAKIYLNTSSLIAFMMDHNITSRPDLALTYYPSEIEFDWFVSRTTSLMDTHVLLNTRLPHPVLTTAYNILMSALKGKTTDSIVSKAKKDDHGDFFFDDFLGNGDRTIDKKPLNRAEDRIFTTTMAVNALTYTWTVFNKEGKECVWKYDVPAKVKTTVEGCVRWLAEHTLDDNYDPWNAFFSGSVKLRSTLPFFYPANLHEHLNGTVIKHPTTFKHGDRQVMSGYVDKASYDHLISLRDNTTYPTPKVFHGYNSGDNEWFPFWSSDAYTYSTTLLAMARYDSIQG